MCWTARSVRAVFTLSTSGDKTIHSKPSKVWNQNHLRGQKHMLKAYTFHRYHHFVYWSLCPQLKVLNDMATVHLLSFFKWWGDFGLESRVGCFQLLTGRRHLETVRKGSNSHMLKWRVGHGAHMCTPICINHAPRLALLKSQENVIFLNGAEVRKDQWSSSLCLKDSESHEFLSRGLNRSSFNRFASGARQGSDGGAMWNHSSLYSCPRCLGSLQTTMWCGNQPGCGWVGSPWV